MLSDDELLDFDQDDLFDVETLGKPYEGRRMLEENGDVFRSQLLLARWIDGWAQRICEEPGPMNPGAVYSVTNTLLELAAYIRQGRFLPEGQFYEDEMMRQPEDWIRPAPPL